MYIGMISGTSVDGIDAVLVDFSTETPKLLATHSESIPRELKTAALTFNTSGDLGIPADWIEAGLTRVADQLIYAYTHRN